MKPSDKQLAAGVKAFNECDIVSTPHCISAAYDAMTEVMTVDDVRAWAKGKGLAVVPLEPDMMVIAEGYGNHYNLYTELGVSKAIRDYKAMIKAAEDEL